MQKLNILVPKLLRVYLQMSYLFKFCIKKQYKCVLNVRLCCRTPLWNIPNDVKVTNGKYRCLRVVFMRLYRADWLSCLEYWWSAPLRTAGPEILAKGPLISYLTGKTASRQLAICYPDDERDFSCHCVCNLGNPKETRFISFEIMKNLPSGVMRPESRSGIFC